MNLGALSFLGSLDPMEDVNGCPLARTWPQVRSTTKSLERAVGVVCWVILLPQVSGSKWLLLSQASDQEWEVEPPSLPVCLWVVQVATSTTGPHGPLKRLKCSRPAPVMGRFNGLPGPMAGSDT
jgi:hypothetical protein